MIKGQVAPEETGLEAQRWRPALTWHVGVLFKEGEMKARPQRLELHNLLPECPLIAVHGDTTVTPLLFLMCIYRFLHKKLLNENLDILERKKSFYAYGVVAVFVKCKCKWEQWKQIKQINNDV